MLKKICSEKEAQRLHTFLEARRKAMPNKGGKRNFWKRMESTAQGRRVGQVNERGKMKTCSREFPHLWERLRQWYQIESQRQAAEGWKMSDHDAALQFKFELEDEVRSLKRTGEECSPDEVRRIQQGERMLDNLKKIHNWKRLRACAEYELQVRGEENSTRGSAEGAREGKRGSAEGRGKRQEENSMHSLASVAAPRKKRRGSGEKRQEENSMHSLASTPRPRWKRLGSGERLELANLEAGCHE